MPSKRSSAAHEEENIEKHAAIMEEDHEADATDRRRKKKKVKIMTNSGLTDADRRQLRNQQRKLQEEIISGDSAAQNEARDRNNELWDKVRYTREAVLDSENVDLIAASMARKAEAMVQVPRYDAARLAQMLVRKASVKTGSNTHFGWKYFGFQTGICFNAVGSHVSFLYGPLDAEYKVKERKKVERKQKQTEPEEDVEEQQPEDVDQSQKKVSDGNELSAVEAHMKTIAKTLKHRAKEEAAKASEREEEFVAKLSEEVEDGPEKKKIIEKKVKKLKIEAQKVNAVQNLFNPQSFTQTVENVFHFSFLIKENKACIEARDAETAEEFGVVPGPVIRPLNSHNMPNEGVPSRQAIVSLNMRVSLDFIFSSELVSRTVTDLSCCDLV